MVFFADSCALASSAALKILRSRSAEALPGRRDASRGLGLHLELGE